MCFGVEYIPNKFKKFIGNKNTMENIFRIQENDSIKILLYYIRCLYA